MTTYVSPEITNELNDADEVDNGTGFSATTNTVSAVGSSNAGIRKNAGFRFENVTVPQGAVVSAANIQGAVTSIAVDDPELDIHAEAIDNSQNFSDNPDVTSRARTTASVSWSARGLGTGYKTSPDIAAVVQEVLDRAGWVSGNAMTIIFKGHASGNVTLQVEEGDGGASADGAILTIEYSSGAAALAVYDYRRRRV